MKEVIVTVARCRSRLRVPAVVAGAVALGFVAAGCSGGGSRSANPVADTGSGASSSAFEAVSGRVIAASSGSASVQSRSGPSTIDFSSATRFTKLSVVSRSSLAKGDCVSVAAATRSGANRTTAGASQQPPREVTAHSVTITSTSRCTQPPAGGALRGPGPSGTPATGGGPGGVRSFTGGSFGTISSITATTFTVTPVFDQAGTATVKTTSTTTYQASSSATAGDLTRGACVSAIGSTDLIGVLQARTVAISQPVRGTCPVAAPGPPGGRIFTNGLPGGAAGAGSA